MRQVASDWVKLSQAGFGCRWWVRLSNFCSASGDSDCVRMRQFRAGCVRLGQTASGWVRLRQVGSDYVRLGQTGSGWLVQNHAGGIRLARTASGWVRLHQFGLYCIRLRQVASGWVRLRQFGPGGNLMRRCASGCISAVSLYVRLDLADCTMYCVQLDILPDKQITMKAEYLYFSF